MQTLQVSRAIRMPSEMITLLPTTTHTYSLSNVPGTFTCMNAGLRNMRVVKVDIAGGSLVIPRRLPHTIGGKTREQRMPPKQANILLSNSTQACRP